ncbi:MAG: hypothetical protein KGL95_15975, partial [Patescibacteria group bacterium]|nr:hypothetical protein [Patescibacteria group bacterium]
MTNYQFGFYMSPPNSSPTPYGNRTYFTTPHGIATIAKNSNAWATAGNLVCNLNQSSYPGRYVECSFTYIKNVTGYRGMVFLVRLSQRL